MSWCQNKKRLPNYILNSLHNIQKANWNRVEWVWLHVSLSNTIFLAIRNTTHYFCNWPGLHKLQENSSACFKSLAYRWLNRSKPSAISAASCAVWFWCRVVWWSSKLAVRQHCLSFHIMKVSRSEASLNSASRLAIVLLTLSCFRCCKKCRKNVKFKAGKIPRMGEECESVPQMV